MLNDSLELREYPKKLPTGTPVAVEASGGWYWFVDRLEEAGLDVRLGASAGGQEADGGTEQNRRDRVRKRRNTWVGWTSALANHDLKWAFVEAANCVVMQKQRHRGRHVIRSF